MPSSRERLRQEARASRGAEREALDRQRQADKEERERRRAEALEARRYPIDDLELLAHLQERAAAKGGCQGGGWGEDVPMAASGRGRGSGGGVVRRGVWGQVAPCGAARRWGCGGGRGWGDVSARVQQQGHGGASGSA